LGDKSAALAVNVALNLALVPLWGIEGAAVAWAVTIVADTALVVYQVQHLMGIQPIGRQVWSAAIFAIGAAAGPMLVARTLWGSSTTVMATTVACTAALYLAASWPLRHRLGLTALIAHRSNI
jgi:O-antigen/teichoic acid export membrane protein